MANKKAGNRKKRPHSKAADPVKTKIIDNEVSKKKEIVEEESHDESEEKVEEMEVEESEISSEEEDNNTAGDKVDDAKASGDENSNDEDDDEDDDEDNKPKVPPPFITDGRYRNKQRCLVICSRGVTARYRHLLEDIRTLLPHHKKDSKLDAGKNQTGGYGRAVNQIAEINSCNSALFLECRKRQDAYLWVGLTPHGPSAKFHISNVHTMDELRLTGNCMKGSRPMLTFDESFSKLSHLKLLKILFVDTFGTPRGHPKSKPFVDRIMGFYYADGKIWVRNYQIIDEQASNSKEAREKKLENGLNTSLVEIGPRFVMNPIRIFSGSFGGQTLYQNEDFVSPNEIRSMQMKGKGHTYQQRKQKQQQKRTREKELKMPVDPLGNVFR